MYDPLHDTAIMTLVVSQPSSAKLWPLTSLRSVKRDVQAPPPPPPRSPPEGPATSLPFITLPRRSFMFVSCTENRGVVTSGLLSPTFSMLDV